MKKKKNAEDRLFKGMIIYFIGTFISKGLTFLILPLITFSLTTEQYGYYDLIMTITMIIIPVFTLQAIEAIFRFLFDADEKKKKTLLSSVWMILIIGVLFCGIVLFFIDNFVYKFSFALWLYIYMISTVILTMYQRVARSYGMNTRFAISGIINTIVVISSQILFLTVFNAKLGGLIIAYSIGALASSIYLEYFTKSIKNFSINSVDFTTIKEIIIYGLPLIPNNISWWGVSAINKFLIINYFGVGANGIFAITAKFTSILSMFTEVFRLSWQESAIVAYNQENKTQFYSNIFNQYIIFLFIGCSAILPIIKIALPILVTSEYQKTWLYIPPAMFGVCLSSIAAFYGAGYSAAKKTKDAFGTTIIGGIVNIIVCVILIKPLGLYAPALSTIVAYLTIWILRQIRMKEYFKIDISIKNIFISIGISIVATVTYYFFNNITNVVIGVLLLMLLAIINKNLIMFMLSKIHGRIGNLRNQ